MEILENKAQWSADFRDGWLKLLRQKGEVNWDVYQHPRNDETPGTPGIRLNQSRLMLISSAGAYLHEGQVPFDEEDRLGDYTLRTFPSSTEFKALAYAHGAYDHQMVEQDAQVALPLRHLEELEAKGEIGELAPTVISFMGYQPDSARVVDELVPQVLAIAKSEQVEAALLAPL
ncbi:MAG: glycine/sarcosine/betaine reductase selenoprotein B family protein [Chloroflexota bacterium]|jgi:hypothetical protein